MTEFEKAVIDKLDEILAEMRAAREERAAETKQTAESKREFRKFISHRSCRAKG